MVRLQGTSITTLSLSLDVLTGSNTPGLGTTMASTPNGRAWSQFQQQINTFNLYTLFYATAGAAQALPTDGFELYGNNGAIGWLATSPDGNVWFVVGAGPANTGPPQSPSEVGYVAENGTNPNTDLHQIIVQLPGSATAIAAGPDGDMWAAVSLSTSTAFYRYSLTGNLAGTVTLSRQFSTICSMITGPDKAIWFTACGTNNNLIGRLTTGGQVTTYPLPQGVYGPNDIAVGGDGALWFTESNGMIGRITTSGQISEYVVPNHDPVEQIVGPANSGCGNAELWVASTEDIFQIIIKT
jgi:hypothetical protein